MRAIAEAMQISRSNLINKLKASRNRVIRKPGDESLLESIREVVRERHVYGYRRITVLVNGKLKKLGCSAINRKKVYRKMKQNNLLLGSPSSKPKRPRTGKVQTLLKQYKMVFGYVYDPVLKWGADTSGVLDRHL